MATDKQINIIIDAQNRTSGAISGVQKSLDGFKSKIESMQPAFQKMAAAGTVAFTAISAVALKAVSAYAEVERSNRQLEHSVIAVSKGTKEQVEQIKELTQALQDKVGVDADSLNMGVAQLSTFGLQTESVVKLTKSLADFTINQEGLNASSDQYIQSANTIAKALNGQFGILEKSGIRFTEAQQNMILFGNETEKVAALQEGLNQNLRETSDTVGGLDVSMAKFKRSVEDVQEGLGKALAPAFAEILKTIQPVIERFTAWAEQNPELLAKIIMVAGAITGLIAIIGILGTVLPAVITGFTLLTGPIGLIILAVTALAAGIMWVINNWGLLKEKVIEVWNNLPTIIQDGIKAVMMPLNLLISFIQLIKNNWGSITKFFQDLWNGITVIFRNAVDTLKAILQPIIDTVNNLINKIQSIGGAIGGGIKKAGKAVGDFLGFDTGGVVPGPRGAPQLAMVHGGETILPTHKSGNMGGFGGGIAITINNPTILDSTMVDRMSMQLSDILRRDLRL